MLVDPMSKSAYWGESSVNRCMTIAALSAFPRLAARGAAKAIPFENGSSKRQSDFLLLGHCQLKSIAIPPKAEALQADHEVPNFLAALRAIGSPPGPSGVCHASLVLGLVKTQVCFGQPFLLGAGDLALNQVVEIRQYFDFVQPDQVGLDHAGLHQVNAGQQHAVHIQQRLDPRRAFLGEELPLGFREAEVMVSVVLRDAVLGDLLQLACSGVEKRPAARRPAPGRSRFS